MKYVSKKMSFLKYIKFKEYIIFNIFIIINLIIPIYSTDSIKIKIKGTGTQQFLSSDFNTIPTNIIFKGNTINPINNEIEITEVETDENELILNWDSSFSNCDKMFKDLSNLIEIDLSDCLTIKCTSMKNMFDNDINLKIIIFGNFDTSLCQNMNSLFRNCNSLISINLNNFLTNEVTNIDSMFFNCTSLTTLDLSNFNTENIVSMKEVFTQCSSLVSLKINNWNTAKVKSMHKMFGGCSSLISLDLNHFNTTLVENMASMFDSCYSLQYLKISNFITSNVKIMSHMFSKCEMLKNLDLSNFDTSKVTIMKNMFTRCRSLTSLDLSNFDTSQVIDMNKMFDSCNALLFLDISNFNTKNVTDMGKMFSGCSSLTSLDLANFDTELVTILEYMFSNCKNLTYLDLSSFNTSKVVNMINMFEGCVNLNYLNILNFEENSELINTNMFLNINDDLVFCINEETNLNSLISGLKEKECVSLDCDSNWLENKKNLLEEKKKDISIFNDKCVYRNIKDISDNFYLSTKISNTTIYSYELNSNSYEIKDKYSNLTYIDFSQEDINFIYEYFNLDKDNDKIYILLSDSISKDSRTATSDYNFIILLENGTQLNFSNINKDFYIDVSVPIRNLDLANFDYAKYFGEQGHDIYNSSSKFYNDFCTPASIDGNDIILKDRKEDIYPNNVTFCKEECRYKSVNIEEQRIICECNLNNNTNREKSDLNIEKKDDVNFFVYIIDKINYKIFKCYETINIENLKKNTAFYVSLTIFAIIIILSLDFLICGLINLRIQMYKGLPTEKKVREMIIEKLKKVKQIRKNKSNPSKKRKSKINKIKNNENNTENLEFKDSKNSNNLSGYLERKSKEIKQSRFMTINHNLNKNNKIIKTEKLKMKELRQNMEQIKKESFDDDDDNIDYNELTLYKAKRIDKRNIFQMFKSILLEKLEIINIIINKKRIKVICICEYILSLIFDFFFNTLLYSDDVISKKYHNNGELDSIISISLSLISNIITSVVCNFIKYSNGIEEYFDYISEIRKEYKYLYAVNKLFKYMIYKMLFFFITEIVLVSVCFYYIIIFCIIFSKSQKSLLINYIYSLLEGLITSLIITIIIVITRKSGIHFSNPYLFNTSKYINNKF